MTGIYLANFPGLAGIMAWGGTTFREGEYRGRSFSDQPILNKQS